MLHNSVAVALWHHQMTSPLHKLINESCSGQAWKFVSIAIAQPHTVDLEMHVTMRADEKPPQRYDLELWRTPNNVQGDWVVNLNLSLS